MTLPHAASTHFNGVVCLDPTPASLRDTEPLALCEAEVPVATARGSEVIYAVSVLVAGALLLATLV